MYKAPLPRYLTTRCWWYKKGPKRAVNVPKRTIKAVCRAPCRPTCESGCSIVDSFNGFCDDGCGVMIGQVCRVGRASLALLYCPFASALPIMAESINYITPADAATALGVTRQRVDQLIRRHRLAVVRIAGHPLILPDELERFAAIARLPGRPRKES